MPPFHVEEAMLGPDGVTFLEPHATNYATFLASQIADLIAYFESRHHRTRGEVNLEDPRNPLDVTQIGSPPHLNWGTPNSSGVSWNNNSVHSTPVQAGKPLSGV